MSGVDTSPDRELLDALRAEAPAEVPDGVRARVFDRVGHTISGLADAAGHEKTTGPRPRAAHGPMRAGLRALATRPVWVAATAFALGGVAGARIHAALEAPPIERVVYIERVVEPTEPRTPSVVEAPAIASVRPVDSRAASRSTPPPNAGSAASAATGLAAERALLDEARKALGAGDYPGAMRAIEQHAGRFPSGLLVEEREALVIKTLAATGRRQEAENLATKFRQRFPKSLFGPTVDEALGTNP